MKAYSKKNLLLKSSQMKTAWLNIVNFSNVYFDLNVARNVYFRMNVLCEDISELSGSLFTQQKMIDILWKDFINQVKKMPNFNKIYDLLMERETKITVLKKEIVQQRKNTFTFFETDEIVQVSKKDYKQNDTINFLYRMSRKQALRGEVLLADIATIHPEHHFTLERVIEIIYTDFIEKYKQGESENVVEQIVENYL